VSLNLEANTGEPASRPAGIFPNRTEADSFTNLPEAAAKPKEILNLKICGRECVAELPIRKW